MANLGVQTGKVKFYNQTKSYGFITSGETDYFFHTTGTLDSVTKDDVVSFELENGKKGLKAINVKKI